MAGIEVGQIVHCDILDDDGKRTGKRVLVKVAEIRLNDETQELESVRVKTLAAKAQYVWVKAEFLSGKA
jgi:hypothetical protein